SLWENGRISLVIFQKWIVGRDRVWTAALLSIDVNAEHFAVGSMWVLTVAIGITLESPVSIPDVEHSIRPKRKAAPVMVVRRLLNFKKPARRRAGIVQQILARQPLDHECFDDGVLRDLMLEKVASVRFELGMKRDTEQAPIRSVLHLITQI